jgi:hypothetical protein
VFHRFFLLGSLVGVLDRLGNLIVTREGFGNTAGLRKLLGADHATFWDECGGVTAVLPDLAAIGDFEHLDTVLAVLGLFGHRDNLLAVRMENVDSDLLDLGFRRLWGGRAEGTTLSNRGRRGWGTTTTTETGADTTTSTTQVVVACWASVGIGGDGTLWFRAEVARLLAVLDHEIELAVTIGHVVFADLEAVLVLARGWGLAASEDRVATDRVLFLVFEILQVISRRVALGERLGVG